MKRTWYILLFILICICTIISFRAYHYYAPPQLQGPYKVSNHDIHDDTTRIAFIGDSWAYMHKGHNCKIAKIIESSTHRPAAVYSFGVCGLTSKEIYENIFDNKDFRHFLSKRHYEFCYVSAGINDTYKKMYTSYYQHSMDCIIQFLLYYHTHPIIQEIPDYNISLSFVRQKTSKQLLRRLSMMINDIPLDCKQIFRDALDELISEKGYQDKVSIIRYKSWNNDYSNDLKHIYLEDGLHLNEYGYAKLDSIIAHEIIASIKKGK